MMNDFFYRFVLCLYQYGGFRGRGFSVKFQIVFVFAFYVLLIYNDKAQRRPQDDYGRFKETVKHVENERHRLQLSQLRTGARAGGWASAGLFYL